MKKWTKFSLLTFGLGLLATFQNCGPAGFHVSESGNSTTSSSNAGGGGSGSGSGIATVSGSLKTNPFSCAQQDSQSIRPLQRLTRAQYSNTVQSILGAQIYTAAKTMIDTLYADTLKKSVRDFSPTITDTQMSAYQSIAEVIYTTITANTSLATSIAGTCITQTPVTATCRDNFVKSFGLKAFRRPLDTTEITKWTTQVFPLGDNGVDSAALVVYGMLMSPPFLLKTELGDAASAATNTYALTPYEVAARLSYDLTDSPPDQALYDAAAANQLSSLTQLSSHVDRLITSAMGRQKVKSFFTFWLDPRRYSSASFAADFLNGLNVTALNDEYDRELAQYVEYMVFTKKATFQDLLTSRESFAQEPAASIYGHAPVTNNVPAQTSADRKGLFMRGSVIATEGNESHPILRGVKVRSRYLCEVMGLPSGVSTSDPTFFSDDARLKLSMRERVTGLTASNSCMACHSSINPAGFALENFDGLGRVRTVERAYSVGGTFIAEHPIVTASSALYFGSAQSYSVNNGLDMIDDMLNENKLPGCFLRQSHRFYRVQEESTDDLCDLSTSYQQMILGTSGGSVLDSLKSMYLQQSALKRRFQ